MKITACLFLAALASSTSVRFETEGVRVGDALVQGAVLELRGAGAEAFLVSGRSVEPLLSPIEIQAAPGRTLVVEPGLRVTRTPEGCRIETHGGRKVRLAAAGEALVAASPAEIRVTADGWTIGDRAIGSPALQASLQEDDADANLQRMQERMRQSRAKARKVRVFRGGDPLARGQAADSYVVRHLLQVSPSGF